MISLANESVFLVHENAFVDQQTQLEEIKKAADFELSIIQIPSQRLSLAEAVNTYLFNSQLVTLPDQSMSLIAPEECLESTNTAALIDEILADSTNPIQQAHYINLRQSMNNGGGPACLRLRIPLSNEALQSIHQGILLTDDLFEKLTQWINKHYREQLVFSDLLDPHLLIETQAALAELEKLIHLKGLYNFY